jgi:transcriptional regulator with XRE-family HTH domain
MNKFKAVLERNNIKAGEFSEKSGIKRVTVYRLMRKYNPTVNTLAKIKKGLEASNIEFFEMQKGPVEFFDVDQSYRSGFNKLLDLETNGLCVEIKKIDEQYVTKIYTPTEVVSLQTRNNLANCIDDLNIHLNPIEYITAEKLMMLIRTYLRTKTRIKNHADLVLCRCCAS